MLNHHVTTAHNYKEFPQSVVVKNTVDEKVGGRDGRIRRFVLSMDGESLDSDLERFQKQLGIETRPLQEYQNYFLLSGSKQIYLRLYDPKSILTLLPGQIEKKGSDLAGKILFVGSHDQHSFYLHKSISGRFVLNDSQSMEYMISDASYLVNALENLRSLNYIKMPPQSVNVLWITVFVAINVFLLFILSPFSFIVASFVYPILFFALNCSIFEFVQFNLDISRVLFCGLLIQYIGVPILLMRYLRRVDSEKLQAEKERAVDKVKSRFIVKVAKADLSLQMAARVSHDIRSPLMALQVANSFIKGKISEDLESLIHESTLRLKFIAEDILDGYREGKVGVRPTERTAIKEVLEELLKSYRTLNPDVKFELEVADNIVTFIPSYSLQRCLSNLFNNSIEAFENSCETVLISASHIDAKKGSCFIINLPEALSRVPLAITSNVLVVESGQEIYTALRNTGNVSLHMRQERTVEAAHNALREFGGKWTVFIDLSLSDEESGFDLIEVLGESFSGKVILCSVFADNMEVQEIANRYDALLLNKELLPRLELIVSNQNSIRGNST